MSAVSAASGRLPVLVGCAQWTGPTTAQAAFRSPVQLMAEVARQAAHDSGAGEALLRAVDSLAVLRLFADAMPRFVSPFGRIVNPPWSLARQLGLQPRDIGYARSGGDSPQVMLHRACERIAEGASEVALIVGAEALHSELVARRTGRALAWGEDAPHAPTTLDPGPPSSFKPHEIAHGLDSPMAMYGLIGQAIRADLGLGVEDYRAACGRLLAPFAQVARDNPWAGRRAGYTAAQIAGVGAENPVLGSPYTKRMTAHVYVDQAAAFFVCAQHKADALGIPRSQRVYLHGGAHAHEQWFVTDRTRLDRSVAMRLCAAAALEQAGRSLADIDLLDLYSCFPAAVQVACHELGLAPDDARGLTVTGGLPFFGGPGNSYSAFAIVEMMRRLRARPGSSGLVLANGGMLTKQAVGVYASAPPPAGWQAPANAALQRQIDQEPPCDFTETPAGAAWVESYVVTHRGSAADPAAIVGRLRADGRRFVARTPADPRLAAAFERGDAAVMRGAVRREAASNVFTPDLP
ncbi:thiolase C-terminal domain-containing protein [Pseudorhodoferax sp.]|uniref:thiolase C-terminal domain-containing protein n=1 Tax=Pseudorhodoferax sp. TaxID=1993553 RepID=UPI002DD67FDC|nr:acetyl-CoA acetyltransferase [Pseudorhodoferax sp.]